MYPGTYARTDPDRIAAVLADSGERLTYAELDERSRRLSRLLYDAGLRRGDVLALLTGNELPAFEVYWAAMRSGLYLTAVNSHLTVDEAAYIVADSGARALVVSAALGDLAAGEAVLHERLEQSAEAHDAGEGHGGHEKDPQQVPHDIPEERFAHRRASAAAGDWREVSTSRD